LGQKLLVFAHHLKVLDEIESLLREANVGFIRVDGTTSKAKKNLLIEKFQNCPEVTKRLVALNKLLSISVELECDMCCFAVC
jgi:SNF2 family DNA or RNA helicase